MVGREQKAPMFPTLGTLDPSNNPTQPGPGFAFRNDDVHIYGVQLRVMATTGYQVGLVEAVYPFQGLCDYHLMAVDCALPDEHAHPGYVLPDVVTRHYGECQILCDTPAWVEHYRAFFKAAVRVHVELRSDNWARFEAQIAKNHEPGAVKEPPALQAPKEVLQGLAEMNCALYKAHKLRMSAHYPTKVS